MRPFTAVVGPLAAASANLYATSQTPTSGTALTLTGSTSLTPRRVLLTFGNEGSARTLTIVGTGYGGNTQSEILAVPAGAGATVASALDYTAISSALPLGGGWTAAITLGTNGSASTPWFRLDNYGFPQCALQVDVSGTVTYSVEQTLEDPNDPTFGLNPSQLTWLPHGVLAAKNASAQDNYAYLPAYTRCTITAGTGSCRYTVIQATSPLSFQ